MTSAGLRARSATVPADLEVDLVALAGEEGTLFARDGIGAAGLGKAAAVDRADVEAALQAIEHEGPPGTAPLAFGALPFLPDAPAQLVIPQLAVRRTADGTWATTIAAGGAPEPVDALRAAIAAAHRPAPADGPSAFDVRASRPPAAWQQAVADATDRIRSGALDKVVLAREIIVSADAPISIATVLTRLSQQFAGCYLYLVDGFCGASPELLVSRHADVVRSQPMAGTAPRRGDAAADDALVAALVASPTYRHEHQVTIDAVHDTLLRFSSYVDYEPEPAVVALANVSHLASHVEGRLSHPPASALELVGALHPTPAVCGRPREAALATIAELEHLDRGRYAGAVGWVDAAGDGEWAVSIRGAEITGTTARVIGGNGIVGDSDPPTELIETRAKLQAMLGAIVRP